jgi:hypothetical protein
MDDVGALPDDPLKMPPPFWRSAGAIFHVLRSLTSLETHLSQLVPLNRRTDERLNEYFNRVPEPPEDDPEFDDICEELWDLEHEIKLDTDIAILMSAICAEDDLNRFCVFNLHQDMAEPLEKLSPPEKLLVASASVGHPGVKSTHAYEALRKLSSWRNAYAHGHCVDRPTKTLRHNHLISPPEYPGVPDSVAACVKMARGYVRLKEHLRSISKNSYTASGSSEASEVEASLDSIQKYRFVGSPPAYTVELRP